MCRSFSGDHIAATFALVAALAMLAASTTAAEPGESVAFRNVRVFDGSRVLPSATVIVKDGTIVRVGPEVQVPDGVRVVDGTGKTLAPGFFDCHTHTLAEAQLQQAAVFGVTTVLDMASDPRFAAATRAKQAAGETTAQADLLSAGPAVAAGEGPGLTSVRQAPTSAAPDQVQVFVDALIAEGSDYIKILCGDGKQIGVPVGGPKLRRETIAAVIAAAHARRKLAVAHVLELEDAREAVADGIDGLVHLFVDAPADDEFLRLAGERKPFVIPTLTALECILGQVSGASLAEDPDLAPFLLAADVRSLKPTSPWNPSRGSTAAERAIPGETIRRLRALGVPILAGTDAPSMGVAYGVSLHRELELLVAAGLSPAEALSTATSLPARAFGLSDRGRIAPGLRADLVLIDGDPTADIKATRKIVGVWKRGRPIDRDARRERVREEARGMPADAKSTPPPGSEGGLVSDFEDGQVRSAFGGGWMLSTDSILGGKSRATLEVAEGGANGSRGALLIRGRIADRTQPRWAGARFLPGRSMFEPANLSAKKAFSFWTKGDGKPYSLMVFTQKGGFTPSVKSFVAGKEWTQYRFELKEFDGCDGSDLMGVFLGGGPEAGEFELRVDDVRFE